MRKLPKKLFIAFIFTAFIIIVVTGYGIAQTGDAPSDEFDGERALSFVEYQVSLGPRTPNSEGHAKIVDWLQRDLTEQGWLVELQEVSGLDEPIRNIVAYRDEIDADVPWYIIGAHYDTRIFADRDPNPENRTRPVPGANDGASGVAVLLELARTIPEDYPAEVWLVFFDAEDNGRIQGRDWILGSRAFVETLDDYPDAVIIVDMIGDAHLNIYMEKNSHQGLTAEVWGQAAKLGYSDYFISTEKHSIVDDHTPFLQAGIPAIDIIDFDYPYWHTVEDTVDKVSAQSLKIVGDTLLAWLDAKR